MSQISIDEPRECGDREFSNLVSVVLMIDLTFCQKTFGNLICLMMQARWLGGSYVGSMESQDGELEFPLASGRSLKLHVSKVYSVGI